MINKIKLVFIGILFISSCHYNKKDDKSKTNTNSKTETNQIVSQVLTKYDSITNGNYTIKVTTSIKCNHLFSIDRNLNKFKYKDSLIFNDWFILDYLDVDSIEQVIEFKHLNKVLNIVHKNDLFDSVFVKNPKCHWTGFVEFICLLKGNYKDFLYRIVIADKYAGITSIYRKDGKLLYYYFGSKVFEYEFGNEEKVYKKYGIPDSNSFIDKCECIYPIF